MKKLKLMRRLFLIIIIILPISSSYSQHFNLYPEGFKSSDDKDYVVINFKGINKNDLYKKTSIYLSSLYKNPKKVLNVVNNEIINISGYTDNAVKGHGINYNLVIKFKDEKIKIDSPTVEMFQLLDRSRLLFVYWDKFSLDGSRRGIFGKKGKLKDKKAKASLEGYFNNFIDTLIIGISDEKDRDW